tara:strand:+ start:4337 stop:5410 length:1074 start_codon:yes stop_codon:yes gene_type:complete
MTRLSVSIVFAALLANCSSNPATSLDAAPEPNPDAAATETISLVGALEITGLPVHDVWSYTDDATSKQYALLSAANAGLRVIDISVRSAPVEVGSLSGAELVATDVKTWRNYAYTIGEGQGVMGAIVDLANPAAPVVVGNFANAHNLFVSDGGYLFASAPGLRIYDLNGDPTQPSEVYSDSDCQGHDVSIVGQRLYDFAGDCGTRIFDIANPASPQLLGTIVDESLLHHSGWPSEDGKHLFLCDELASPTQDDIAVWDIADLASPQRVGSYSDANAFVHNLYVVGDYAYVSYYRAGFRVFDVSDPAQIRLVDEYDTDPAMSGPGFGGNFGVYPFSEDGVILASDEGNGLFLFAFDGQ